MGMRVYVKISAVRIEGECPKIPPEVVVRDDPATGEKYISVEHPLLLPEIPDWMVGATTRVTIVYSEPRRPFTEEGVYTLKTATAYVTMERVFRGAGEGDLLDTNLQIKADNIADAVELFLAVKRGDATPTTPWRDAKAEPPATQPADAKPPEPVAKS